MSTLAAIGGVVYHILPRQHEEKSSDIVCDESRGTGHRLWAVVVILFFVACLECVMLIYGANHLVHHCLSTDAQLKTPVPNLATVTTNFQQDSIFRNLGSGAAVHHAWQSTMSVSPTSGFVKVVDPEQYQLIPNDNVLNGTHNSYMVSFYHQLHCLQELQSWLVESQSVTTTSRFEADPRHVEHCVDYLRHGVMCAGDMTLEGPDARPEAGESPLRGYGIPHACKNWHSIVDWMHENAAV